ncbi:hypothetical protein D9M68_828370 [compost metagenome]
MLGVLEVLDPGQQHASVGDDGAAGLEYQGQVATGNALAHRLDVVAGQRWLLVAVLHAEAAAEVQVLDLDAAHGQAVDQHQQTIQGVEERRQGS